MKGKLFVLLQYGNILWGAQRVEISSRIAKGTGGSIKYFLSKGAHPSRTLPVGMGYDFGGGLVLS